MKIIKKFNEPTDKEILQVVNITFNRKTEQVKKAIFVFINGKLTGIRY